MHDMVVDQALRQRLLRSDAVALAVEAEKVALAAFGNVVTYSRKVFIPLTQLCRDVCHYCTFAQTPKQSGAPFLTLEQVLRIAQAGAAAGCREALFTLGERPEDRYPAAREALNAMGHADTLSYLREMAAMVLEETGLLPHLNPGLMGESDYRALRPVSASMGLMLETIADRLSEKGGPHYGSPDKLPARRLAAIEAAGRNAVPFTTGLLIGIGETRAERLDALFAIADSQRRHGHIQEVIIQNFRAKAGTPMAGKDEPTLDDHVWTIAAARLILDSSIAIQAPPNLHRPEALARLISAGVNDWGGVSPVTPDHVNPEKPWPDLARLDRLTALAGRELRERLAIAPVMARDPARWLEPAIARVVRRSVDARGMPMNDGWRAGMGMPNPPLPSSGHRFEHGGPADTAGIGEIITKAQDGQRLCEADIVRLFNAEGADFRRVCESADALRQRAVGGTVSYVVNRNINYTNICLYKCGFCAFSKGSSRSVRGPAYRLDLTEVARRAAEAVTRGATEVCLQGGIHPDYDGQVYIDILRAVKQAAPDVHIHAFSPLEVTHGAQTLGVSLHEFLYRLKEEGLATLPGTAAEILDDEVRQVICPDKLTTSQWLGVMRTAHALGLKSTATIMFGHVEAYTHWARHLLAVRDLQAQTGGFTEFVPLPFVAAEAPIWRHGRARSGPSFREAILMHAVARLVLHPLVPNIQASWVKLGPEGSAFALRAGANDLGGTLMDESITRAAGGVNGQHYDAAAITAIAAKAQRPARQRTTTYGDVVAVEQFAAWRASAKGKAKAGPKEFSIDDRKA